MTEQRLEQTLSWWLATIYRHVDQGDPITRIVVPLSDWLDIWWGLGCTLPTYFVTGIGNVWICTHSDKIGGIRVGYGDPQDGGKL